ncbi:Protein CBG02137 [Caenorhabditis briggsae]|uniref:Protein CBG02137 n=1 Tax=Caenorhabditis briggsae TaxID=6238 RepID=A8WS18_CAEBR|nr:Protein CBG02137 [Caenorhabditis briggsae]CAP23276.2 Protein CBG02137 [Caenorhabditis briggsae]
MRDMQPPSMGVNGFGRRSHNFSSPSLVDYRSQPHHYGSQPSIVRNGGSQSPPDYALLPAQSDPQKKNQGYAHNSHRQIYREFKQSAAVPNLQHPITV